MQPMIICTAPVPGMIYLNGRFVGEASAERPLFAPVSPYGALYMEYRPLIPGYSAIARKCVFSAGKPIPDSLADADGISAVAWPGNILELEFSSEQYIQESFMLENRNCTLSRGASIRLFIGSLALDLPDRAERPDLIYIHDCPVLSGGITGGGQYIITLNRDLSFQTGFLAADRIDFNGQDMLHALIHMDDLAGHARLERWFIDISGLQRVSSEQVWSEGIPRRPQSAEETMRAAIEAALLGMINEVEGYLIPSLQQTAPFAAISDICDLCVSMKYGSPDSRPCVGLMRMENAHFAAVRPLYYGASISPSEQSEWKIEWISME